MARPVGVKESKPRKRVDKVYCVGCGDNFYNGSNDMGIKECWNFKSAKVVNRFRIGWWTPQDRKENFTKVTTFNCHKEIGRFAFYDKLPSLNSTSI